MINKVTSEPRIAAIIPAYNESATIRAVVEKTLTMLDQVIVVDDGSMDGTLEQLTDLPVITVTNPSNIGKGQSLIKGFREAQKLGVEGVITLDADGQHDPACIPQFIKAFKAHPHSVIVGARLLNSQDRPKARRRANETADFSLSWATGHRVVDSQSGFKLYPLELIKRLNFKSKNYRGFVFENKIVIAAANLKFYTYPIPIAACYPKDMRPSYYKPFLDTAQIVLMIGWEILRRGFAPARLYRAFAKKPTLPHLKPVSSAASRK